MAQRGSKTIKDEFEKNPCAYLGITMPNFPNFFFVLGPHSVLAHNTLIFMAECEVNYIMDVLKQVIKSEVDSVDVKKCVTDAFARKIEQWTMNMNFSGGCRSWYRRKKDGKNFILWPSNLYHYWWITHKANLLRDYKLTISAE